MEVHDASPTVPTTPTPYDKVLALFGVKLLVEVTGCSRVQIWRWGQPKNKGGSDGKIPSRHHQMLIAEAEKRGLDLKPEHLMPWLVEASAA